MPGCHGSGAAARRPFIITPYSADESGVLEPAIPLVGPCSTRDRQQCALRVDHLRERKTGPRFPLTILACGTHRVAFTLYPPGHAPYGRVRLAPLAPDGRAIVGGPAGGDVFEETLFGAAVSASKGRAWDRERVGGSERWWGTQWRRLAVALRLCGVAPELGEKEREAVAAALGVALLLLREQAHAIAARPGYRRRGLAVCTVLGRLGRGPCLLRRLMAAGQLAGLWGPPLLWQTQVAQLRSCSFRGLETAPQ